MSYIYGLYELNRQKRIHKMQSENKRCILNEILSCFFVIVRNAMK